MAVTFTGDVRPYSGTGTAVPVVFTVADAPRTLTSPNRVIFNGSKSLLTETDGTFSTTLEPGAYTVLINNGTTLTVQVPTTDADLGDAGVIISAVTPGAIPGAVPEITTSARLIEMAAAEAYQLTSITRDADGTITTATVAWPDGSSGVFTTVTKNATWLSIDAYTVTHAGTSKTVTQPLVTRDADGFITTKPALTVT